MGAGARDLSVVVDGMTFTECPRWRDGTLYFADFYTYRVLSVVPGSDPQEVVSVPQQPSGLGWLPDGRMLVVSMRDRKILRQETSGELVEHADLSAVATGHVNDMVVAPSGVAYAGNFGFDLMAGAPMTATPLARIDPDGTVSIASEPLMFPNGSAITPDGSTLIISESFGNRMSAFDIAADGSLGPRRDWAALGPVPTTDDLTTALGAAAFAPDGMCLDAEGAVWVADAVGNRVLRLAEGGEILDEIATGDGCYACMLGGDDGTTLFLCVAPDFHEDARAAAREGRILATTVAVPHAGTP
jgi:sugar lactone lactonase YvrE